MFKNSSSSISIYTSHQYLHRSSTWLSRFGFDSKFKFKSSRFSSILNSKMAGEILKLTFSFLFLSSTSPLLKANLKKKKSINQSSSIRIPHDLNLLHLWFYIVAFHFIHYPDITTFSYSAFFLFLFFKNQGYPIRSSREMEETSTHPKMDKHIKLFWVWVSFSFSFHLKKHFFTPQK